MGALNRVRTVLIGIQYSGALNRVRTVLIGIQYSGALNRVGSLLNFTSEACLSASTKSKKFLSEHFYSSKQTVLVI